MADPRGCRTLGPNPVISSTSELVQIQALDVAGARCRPSSCASLFARQAREEFGQAVVFVSGLPFVKVSLRRGVGT